ncbi:fatty acid desaturase [Leptospira sp. GIMC2001]|uniref:fatty acid desaturase n=1 Tax=Leptospira sp. GIMC2001 TaxID=1513297 RepID=UPI00234AEF0E|nr:fatty acid desaturase [Leptospira sp. GIMC2001]WCL49565.1 fatty acid desaturase [Leptospira sp. GIMC2001]
MNSSQYSIVDIRKTIPDKYFKPNLYKSIFYFIWDVSIIGLLYYSVFLIDSIYYLPFFWFLTGTMFWALFVVGHDCGHGSFSKISWLNSLIGHLAHTPILVPYHGWRISHRIHHSNTGNPDKDETWYPISDSQYEKLSLPKRIARYKLFLIVFPLYLFVRSPGKDGSHFHPKSNLFKENERSQVVLSTTLWVIMVCFLGWTIFQYGIISFLIYYFVPYTIFVIWLSLVTYLHHTDVNIPWYRNEDWTFLKGAMSTIDRSYGIFEPIHHNIGSHVIHHIFAGIPHYNLLEAKKHLKKALGSDYRESKNSLFYDFMKSYRDCITIPDKGNIVYYKRPESN